MPGPVSALGSGAVSGSRRYLEACHSKYKYMKRDEADRQMGEESHVIVSLHTYPLLIHSILHDSWAASLRSLSQHVDDESDDQSKRCTRALLAGEVLGIARDAKWYYMLLGRKCRL